MNDLLFIDIETYSSEDIANGHYKYIESPDFEILLIGYALNDGEVKQVDMLLDGDEQNERNRQEFFDLLGDPTVIKVAHNATFERNCFKRIGWDIKPQEWICTMTMAAYNGLPLALKEVSKVLDLQDKKLDTGTLLIKYFSCPVKPTKINGGRTRNYPHHNPEKWAQYKEYNLYDVLSEREIYHRLEHNMPSEIEHEYYCVDQAINDRGIQVDMELVNGAIAVSEESTNDLTEKLKALTGLSNPNSAIQLKQWLASRSIKLDSLAKKAQAEVQDATANDPVAREATELKAKLGKTSIKKYEAFKGCAMADNRVRGTFQFYGANRTGRWAGRLVQLQNLSKNHMDNLDMARAYVKMGDFAAVDMAYGDAQDVLSQLVRTAIIARDGYTLIAADYSAIEARVISWLAMEQWRLDVFHGDGKIYEATGSRMFGVPKESIKKGSELRDKAKISELALGYGGSLGALKNMGGEKMGLSDPEMMSLVKKWRAANPKIVEVWDDMENAAMTAIVTRKPTTATPQELTFRFNPSDKCLYMKLPSGRELCYQNARMGINDKGKEGLLYDGVNQVTRQWGATSTFGGKLTENAVQAMARDLLADLMYRLTKKGYQIVAHIHDEVIVEVPIEVADASLGFIIDLMRVAPDWCKGLLPLNADGYVTPYYKKD